MAEDQNRKAPPAVFTRLTYRRLKRTIVMFLRSPHGSRARLLLAALLGCMLCINGMNVLNSYVGRFFMSSIEKKDMGGFIYYAWMYVAVFAGSTIVAVFFRFSEERLGLLWRGFLTHRIVTLYMQHRIYLHTGSAEALTNPDQRIAEDVKQLTVTTLSFVLLILNATMTVISFSGVLWSISPTLFVVAVLYAIVGSVLTIVLGRPLIALNYRQADREADFRSELIRLRESADGVAVTGNEGSMRDRLLTRIDLLVANFRHITSVNRNLNFFSTGYNYMIQLIPALFVAPLFMHGKADFGVIGQSAMAFVTLVAAFSLIITQFQAISAYASVISRLSEFMDEIEKHEKVQDATGVEFSTGTDRFVYTNLVLRSGDKDGSVLLKDLNATLSRGTRVRVHSQNQAARHALFRASIGLYDVGSGSVEHPPKTALAFLPEKPYLPRGTAREILIPAGSNESVSNEDLTRLFAELGLDSSKFRTPEDFEVSRNWEEALSLSKQHLMSVARAILAKPQFVFLDHIESALNERLHPQVLAALASRGITCVSFGEDGPDPALHDAALEIKDDGSWKWTEL
jgi:putative ATP-binding cassette transporter